MNIPSFFFLNFDEIYVHEHYNWLLSGLSKKSGRLVRIVRIVDLAGLGAGHMDPAGLSLLRGLINMTTGVELTLITLITLITF